MSTYSDRDRSRRRRRNRTGRKEFERDEEREEDNAAPSQPKGPSIILGARRPADRPSSADSSSVQVKPPTVLVKQREDRLPSTTSNTSTNIPSLLAGDSLQPQVYVQSRHVTPGVARPQKDVPKLTPLQEMTHSVKLVDDGLCWCDSVAELMLDQTDFLVVGSLGLQGCGKSTIMSLLANTNAVNNRWSAFKVQGKDNLQLNAHKTMGVDMFVTSERVILLDSQPLLSASLLQHMIQYDQKFSADYITAENCLHMQSLMLASWMLTVCNVVLVPVEWFADVNFLRLLQTAEMLKPSTPPSHDSAGNETQSECHPHVVFVLNGAEREDFGVENYSSMLEVVGRCFEKSKLKTRGGVNLGDSLIPGISKSPFNDVNLYLLPKLNPQQNSEGPLALIPDFKGHPSYESLSKNLRNKILSIPRHLITHTTLSEKNWFHYAAKSLDTIKKSSLLAEYNRLLP